VSGGMTGGETLQHGAKFGEAAEFDVMHGGQYAKSGRSVCDSGQTGLRLTMRIESGALGAFRSP
jgi:hypothetical protein